VFDGKYISGSNSYGAQARGSGCKSEIVFSDGPVDFPHLTTADILIAMSQGAYNIYCGDVREESGLILYDQGLVTPKENLRVRHLGIPATDVSVKRLKNKQAANIVFLGALIEATRIVSPGAIRKAISTHVSERFRSLNLKALRTGMELGRKAHG
jgi:2-oxoglutarate ferredoxin oxidoreductase subunit gamma